MCTACAPELITLLTENVLSHLGTGCSHGIANRNPEQTEPLGLAQENTRRNEVTWTQLSMSLPPNLTHLAIGLKL